MKRVFAGGLLLAVLGTLAVLIFSALGFSLIDLNEIMFGACAGAVLGLIATRSPLARIGGFLIGLVVTWAMYGIAAKFFPNAAGGVALQVFITLVVLTLIGAALHSKVPFWSIMLGLVAFSGLYQYLYTADPSAFVADSFTSAGEALIAGGLGFVAVVVADLLPLGPGEGDDLAVVEPQFAASSSTSAKG